MHPRHYTRILGCSEVAALQAARTAERKSPQSRNIAGCREFSQELEISSASLQKGTDTRYTGLFDRASRHSQNPVGAVEGARNGTVAGHPTNNRVALRGPLWNPSIVVGHGHVKTSTSAKSRETVGPMKF
jgi:hypothetical protein